MECNELNNLKCKWLKIKLLINSQSATWYLYMRYTLCLVLLLATFQKAAATEFDLVTDRNKVSIVYGAKAPKLDSISAYLLAGDIKRVTGYLPLVGTDISKIKGNVIVIGQAQSALLKTFSNQANLQQLAGKWESYQIEVILNPRIGIKKALIIAGSDTRGTAYGVFDISARIGVNAWYWWADVIPEKKKSLALNITTFTSAVPSVKYRGIFINDEDWGLQPWAAKTFEPETKDIGPKTYARVFELLLRLKANLIWPAMHPSTKAFFYYPDNKKVASDYDIVIGSSHAEPMLRNNVDEWDKKTMGNFNYITNSAKVKEYWESRVKESSTNNAIYSLGMRGVHDSGIEGVKSMSETVPLLERIISNQRDMLSKYINKDIKKVPQAFTAYKEVLDIYDYGLKLPDDATIIWPDDNYGYIQRLNNYDEDKRSGGSGVYYHASYWGRPHDYLWLSTTNPGLIQEEMKKAFELNAKNIWVLNVGDIKPGEYNMQLFMDMAYDFRPFQSNADVKTHLTQWTEDIFGSAKAHKISAVLWNYYQLAFERKPEFMGWSQTEPTTGINFTRYNHQYYGDQAQRRLDAYTGLEKQLESLKTGIPANRQASFYQLVYYPVIGSSLMNKKFLYHDKAFLYAKQGRRIADYYAALSAKAYDDIVKETTYYNEGMMYGKWKGMMSMVPRNLPVFKKPDLQLNITDTNTAWAALPEGYNEQLSAAPSLSFDHQSAAKQFIDIFLQRDTALTYKIQSSAPWISVSQTSGKLTSSGDKSQQRLWVNIDWTKAPKNQALSGHLSLSAAEKTLVIPITSKNDEVNVPSNGFIEHQGYVSIYAKNYTGITAAKEQHWAAITGMGLTGKSMESLPLKSPSAPKLVYTETEIKAQPSLTYDFFSRSSAAAEFKFFTIPTFPLNKNTEMRYAVSIDDGPATVINFRTIGRSEEWKQNVLSNAAVRSVKLPELKAGKHQVRIYLIDPGVILDRILVDLGGLQPYYGLIPETRSY
jgi:hypothetical protein